MTGPAALVTDPSGRIVAMSRAVTTLRADAAPEEIADVLRTDGCVILGDLVRGQLMDQVTAEMEPHLSATSHGRTEFLGRATRRAGALIARSPAARSLVTHPAILAVMDIVLGDHSSTYQIDLTQLVDIGPGESAQMIHRDQWSYDHYPFPKGFEAEVGTMWAATDFSDEMGATRVIVGSHLWEDEPAYLDPTSSSVAVMTKGSVLIYTGSVFHGGGANTTDRHRIGVNVGYSLGWLRQEENQFLACPADVARSLPEGLLRLMGYQRGSFALGYVDDMRDPIDWLYGRSSAPKDFLSYRRSALRLLRRTGIYSDSTLQWVSGTTRPSR